MTIKTERGEFRQDKSGLYHYIHNCLGTVDLAIKDALKHKPKGAAWFWFNETPVPIWPTDNVKKLYARWSEWRQTYQEARQNHDFLKLLLQESHQCTSKTSRELALPEIMDLEKTYGGALGGPVGPLRKKNR